MEPLLGVFAGYCLGRGGVIAAGPQLEPYVQEALEEIEYLIGDANTTKWGAQRAKDGHPKPFKMHLCGGRKRRLVRPQRPGAQWHLRRTVRPILRRHQEEVSATEGHFLGRL